MIAHSVIFVKSFLKKQLCLAFLPDGRTVSGRLSPRGDRRMPSACPSSPVCRINEKLANTTFASSFFAQKSGLPLILTLIDAYGSAKPIPALFARCIKIPLADLLCFQARKSRFPGFILVCIYRSTRAVCTLRQSHLAA